MYAAFGLRLDSAIELPELAPAADQVGPEDITIELGAVPERLTGGVDLEPLMQVAGEEFQLNVAAGRFRVRAGRHLNVEPAPGASARDVRLHILGTAMAAVLHQRRLLPLHAAVVNALGGAVAFVGPSGAGKSTLAAQLLRRGSVIMADDLGVVDFGSDGAPRIHPGVQRIKLWPDSPAMAGLEGAKLTRIADGVAKYSLPLTECASAYPLLRVYALQPSLSAHTDIQPLRGAERLAAVLGNTYRWPVAIAVGNAASCLTACSAISTKCEIFVLRSRHDPQKPFEVVDAVQHHLAS
jgi:hypothetical protein